MELHRDARPPPARRNGRAGGRARGGRARPKVVIDLQSINGETTSVSPEAGETSHGGQPMRSVAILGAQLLVLTTCLLGCAGQAEDAANPGSGAGGGLPAQVPGSGGTNGGGGTIGSGGVLPC